MDVRMTLSLGLSLATLALAVGTALLQSHNRAEAARLDEQLSTTKLIEAVNDERSTEIVARDYAPPHRAEAGKEQSVAAATKPVVKPPAAVRKQPSTKDTAPKRRANGVL